MEMTHCQAKSRCLLLHDSSQVGDARRTAVGLAEGAGLDSTQVGQVAIIATELGQNLLKHAGSGEIVMRPVLQGNRRGVELLSIDKGPGMADVSKCLQDGYSTAGSCGTGLGSISRLSTHFEIYSEPQQGAVIMSEVLAPLPPGEATPRFQFGGVCLAMHEGEGCGDAWSVLLDKGNADILMVDGLGHGEFAAAAADEAVRVFNENNLPNLREQMQYMHGALKKTRGAALALARVDAAGRQLHFIGIGNIAGNIFTNGQSRTLLSHNGTVGMVMERTKEFDYAWSPDSLLIMHSDGLTAKWDLQKYPGLLMRHPSVIAGVLYRDYRRVRDDASVLVMRESVCKTQR